MLLLLLLLASLLLALVLPLVFGMPWDADGRNAVAAVVIRERGTASANATARDNTRVGVNSRACFGGRNAPENKYAFGVNNVLPVLLLLLVLLLVVLPLLVVVMVVTVVAPVLLVVVFVGLFIPKKLMTTYKMAIL